MKKRRFSPSIMPRPREEIRAETDRLLSPAKGDAPPPKKFYIYIVEHSYNVM
jgi:hypothetical protein